MLNLAASTNERSRGLMRLSFTETLQTAYSLIQYHSSKIPNVTVRNHCDNRARAKPHRVSSPSDGQQWFRTGSASRLGSSCFWTRRMVYRVLGRHEVAQEPSGSGEYTGSTTFLRAPNRPKEGDGAKGVRSKVSAGRLAGGGLEGLGLVGRIEVRKASQQRVPWSTRRCPEVFDIGSGGIGLALIRQS